MPVRVVLVGDGTTAGTAISLPKEATPAYSILSATKYTLTEGTPNTFTATSLTVTSSTPGAGEIQLASESTIVLGDDFATTDILVLDIVKKTEYPTTT